jgi:dCTP deaminase
MLGNTLIEKYSRSINLIGPYRAENQQPASYDLTLGNEFRELEPQKIDGVGCVSYYPLSGEIALNPGDAVLGTTMEKVKIPWHLCGIVDGRSSWGRCFLGVHCTAGFCDPGFEGHVTLEIKNLTKNCVIVLTPGRRIAQIRFKKVEGCDMAYDGKYQGQATVTGSRINHDTDVSLHLSAGSENR